jgi:uncharacterized membrane protein
MANLIAAAIVFILIHRLISGGPARPLLVRALGEKSYRAFFAVLSFAILTWMVIAYARVHPIGTGAPAWSGMSGIGVALCIVQLLAIILVVPGVMAPNPTIAGLGDTVAQPGIVRGMLRITRHPFLWGVALFSAGHLVVRHDAASLVLFGTLIFVALVGTISIDVKRHRSHGTEWARFRSETSNVPFAAILSGRQRLSLREIGAFRLVAALAVWAALIWAHPFFTGGVGALR